MISFDEAYKIAISSARPVETENVNIGHALHRILAEDAVSDINMPPFNKSAMDGYACRRNDLTTELTVIETIPAGKTPLHSIGEKECAKIMTGGVVPEGADCVIMVEFTEITGDNRIRFTSQDTQNNICLKAEDVRKGDIVVRAGEIILPQHIAVLASIGCTQPLVSQKARVGIIATGNELVEPTERPNNAQIRNSNSGQLCAQVESMTCTAQYYGIAEDSRDTIGTVIGRAAEENNVIIVSGGVSAGDYDFVPPMLKENDFELLFEQVATKPGKPTVFGISDSAFCFGLPGNPVSTFILFEILVKPFLYRIMGYDFIPSSMPMRLKKQITRKKINRDSWIPVKQVSREEVEPVEYHGSGHVHSLVGADGMICIKHGTHELTKGTLVDVRHI
ncbi:MAG: molybdopterin molybdotransferase MoeA [Kiritimatiellae bacterium]|nr:molybdopterin molybdotransferase MoeA [Kiritimatiellia bacterium]